MNLWILKNWIKIAFDFKKVYKELCQPKKIQILNIPPINYVAVRSKGDPNESNGAYQKAISVLYAVFYTLKMSYKSDYKTLSLRLKGFGGKMI